MGASCLGATTVDFRSVSGAVIDPYPYRDVSRIVQLVFASRQVCRGRRAVSAHDFEVMRYVSTADDARLTDFADPVTTIAGYPEDLALGRLSGWRLAMTSEAATVATGIAAGLLLSMLCRNTLRSVMILPRGNVWLVFVSAAIMLGVSAVACAIPAWRASRLDPGQALRAE